MRRNKQWKHDLLGFQERDNERDADEHSFEIELTESKRRMYNVDVYTILHSIW